MLGSRIPTFAINLAVVIINAFLTNLLIRETVGVVRPFHLIPACQTNIAFFMRRTWLPRGFASADSIITVPLVTLSIRDALPASQKVNLILFFADTVSLGFLVVDLAVLRVRWGWKILLGAVNPCHIIVRVVQIANVPIRAGVEWNHYRWVWGWMLEAESVRPNSVWAIQIRTGKRINACDEGK